MYSIVKFLNEPAGLRYHVGALVYVLLSYVVGFAGLFYGYWAVKSGGDYFTRTFNDDRRLYGSRVRA